MDKSFADYMESYNGSRQYPSKILRELLFIYQRQYSMRSLEDAAKLIKDDLKTIVQSEDAISR